MPPRDETKSNTSDPNGLLYLFPFEYPDELHASQASRYHFHSGNRDTTITYRALYNTRPFRITSIVPPHIHSFAAKFPGNDPRERLVGLLRRNTLIPLFEIFCGTDLSKKFELNRSLEKSTCSLPRRVVGDVGNIRLCLECMEYDLQEHGEAYIHRSHQIPGINVCFQHTTPLISCCPGCRQPFESETLVDLVLAPWQRCICGMELREEQRGAAAPDHLLEEMALARFGMELLNSPSRFISREVLSEAYRAKLVELQFGRKSIIDRQALSQAITEHYGERLLSQTDYAFRTARDQHWLRLYSVSAIHDAPVTRHLLLANFLFRDSKSFWQSIDAASAVVSAQQSKPRRQPTQPTCNDLIKDEDKERQLLRQAVAENPNWSLDDLWTKRRGALKRLLKRGDKAANLAWLQALTKQGTEPHSKHDQSTSVHPDDALWAKRFEEVALKHYKSTDRPIKLSHHRILSMAGWKAPTHPQPDKFPLAAQRLSSLVESSWHYYARRILWAKALFGGPGVANYRITTPAIVEHHRGKYLLQHFASMPQKVELRPNTILYWLEHFGIPKTWSGPEHQAHYSKPGRSYVSQKRLSSTD